MNEMVTNMAEEFSKNWHEQGNNVIENMNKLLRAGDFCIDLWLSPVENNDKYNSLNFERKILQYFDAIDDNLLNMQKSVINVLRYLSYTRQQLEERIEFKNTHSRCQTKIEELQKQNLLFKEEIENEKQKYQKMLQNTQDLKKSQKDDSVCSYKEQEIQNLNREIGKVYLENRYLKERLTNTNEECNIEIKRLQIHLKQYKKAFEEMDADEHVLHKRDEDYAIMEDKFAKDVDVFKKDCLYFVSSYKKLLLENQQLYTESNKSEEKDNLDEGLVA